MKKIVFIVITLFVFAACIPLVNKNKINPPQWIWGVWVDDNPLLTSGYRFTPNEFYMLLLGTELNEAERLMEYDDFSILDEKTDSTYRVQITAMGFTMTYAFEKIDENTINATWPLSGTYTKKVD